VIPWLKNMLFLVLNTLNQTGYVIFSGQAKKNTDKVNLFVLDCLDAGGRARQRAVVESLSKDERTYFEQGG